MHISLTEKQDEYVRQKVASGLYDNASEVVRGALRLKIATDESDEDKRQRLRAGTNLGWERAALVKLDMPNIPRKLDLETVRDAQAFRRPPCPGRRQGHRARHIEDLGCCTTHPLSGSTGGGSRNTDRRQFPWPASLRSAPKPFGPAFPPPPHYFRREASGNVAVLHIQHERMDIDRRF